MSHGLKLRRQNLVLLPGIDGSGRLFEPFLGIVTPGVHPIVVPFPPDEPLNYQQLIPEMREVVPWDEPFLLVAESYSGPLALLFTAAQWECVEGVVLVSSWISNPLPSFMNWVYQTMGETLFKTMAPKAVLKKLLLGREHPPSLEATLAECLSAVQPGVLAARIRLVIESDCSEALRSVEKPILYLQGTQDELVGTRGLRQIQKVKPGVAHAQVEGPHMLMQTRPREVWSIVQRFWQEAAGRAAA